MAITQKQLTSNVIDNPCRSSFSHNKLIFTVEMIDPVITKLNDGTYAIPNALYLGDPERGVLGSQMLDGAITLGEPELPTWGVKHAKINAKNKTQVITGLFVPATFRVIGFKYQITFTTFQDKSNKRGIGIESINIKTNDDSIRREGRDPAARLFVERHRAGLLGPVPVAGSERCRCGGNAKGSESCMLAGMNCPCVRCDRIAMD